MDKREFHGVYYEVRKGFGFPVGLIPVIGAVPIITNEPVRLITTNPTSTQRAERIYDTASDIYQEHPEIWTENKLN